MPHATDVPTAFDEATYPFPHHFLAPRLARAIVTLDANEARYDGGRVSLPVEQFRALCRMIQPIRESCPREGIPASLFALQLDRCNAGAIVEGDRILVKLPQWKNLLGETVTIRACYYHHAPDRDADWLSLVRLVERSEHEARHAIG